MTEPETLTDEEIRKMTGLIRPTAQLRRLKKMGLPARLEHGIVIASRVQLREWLQTGSTTQAAEPNWAGVR